ncbi:MAG: NAD(P)H-hydrate dehydratase [Eubacteriales bacterium]|jgi:hydroxyethylthiazole kinase-like uncharacterized protein yjeF|nr:NAD(P)H-hydrate dehydratase [Eubacteriales bacterium]
MEETITKERAARLMLPLHRPPDAYKNMCGVVGAVAGSAGMAGAAVLCGRAALRTGCGLMQYYAPAAIRDVLQIAVPEATWYERVPDEKILSVDVIAMGPGLGYHEEDQRVLDYVFSRFEGTLVLDADGLNDVVRMDLAQSLRRGPAHVIMTPHPGEASRLLGGVRITDRIEAAKALAERYEAVVVLKGHETILCRQGEILVNRETGNPGMATGGSGDVLTGTIASLAAQGLPPWEAAQAGVYLHGLAGDLAAGEKGENGLLAGDICETLPLAIKTMIGR